MSLNIRPSTPDDAPSWLSLLKNAIGDDHPTKEIYDPAWIMQELGDNETTKTWVAEKDGMIVGSVSILAPFPSPETPVINLAREIFVEEAYSDGSAEALLAHVAEQDPENREMIVTRVLASDNKLQIVFEKSGYVCVGYQPLKHLHRSREGVLFYVRPAKVGPEDRLPMSESLPQTGELATTSLTNCDMRPPSLIRDGITGYPLKTEVECSEVPSDEFDLWKMQVASSNPPKEISGAFHLGYGFMRVGGSPEIKASLAKRETKVVAGISYYFDEMDRCVRITDAFSIDDLSMGGMLQHAVVTAQEELSAVFVEMDILSTAPRLIKSAEQIGFVPVSYMPAFASNDGYHVDVIKMVKLNTSYSLDNIDLTSHAETVVKVVGYNFQDQKTGVAIINLLRGLPIFEGLGDGELRKIARLFTQKLYRPAEKVFNKGEQGNEAFVVMRGKIDILLEEGSQPVASLTDGQIFGEQSFLDGSARVALAQADRPSILLVVQRANFNDLVQREPHLGMVVMQNIAKDLSKKLKRANTALSATRR